MTPRAGRVGPTGGGTGSRPSAFITRWRSHACAAPKLRHGRGASSSSGGDMRPGSPLSGDTPGGAGALSSLEPGPQAPLRDGVVPPALSLGPSPGSRCVTPSDPEAAQTFNLGHPSPHLNHYGVPRGKLGRVAFRSGVGTRLHNADRSEILAPRQPARCAGRSRQGRFRVCRGPAATEPGPRAPVPAAPGRGRTARSGIWSSAERRSYV